MESHLLQMRGLKRNQLYTHCRPRQSHLLQMRGLKQLYLQSHLRTAKSHLLQMRGLKPWRPRTKYKSYGRIFYRCVD